MKPRLFFASLAFLAPLPTLLAASLDPVADAALGQPDLAAQEFTTGPAQADRFDSAGPGALTVDQHSGRVFVCDVANNRILSWPDSAGFTNGQSADVVLGQTNFLNHDAATSATTLKSPMTATVDRMGNLYVADTGNHRVLGYRAPFSTGMAATLVMGQADFISGDERHGATDPDRTTLTNPMGVCCDEFGNLWVSDTSESRVLFYEAPFYNDTIADGLLGHAENGTDYSWSDYETNSPSPERGLYWPAGLKVSVDGSRLAVADWYNHRVVVYALNTTQRPWGTPTPGMNAVAVLGQSSLSHLAGRNREDDPGHNFGDPHAETLDFPIDVAWNSRGDLLVADSDNNRVAIFPPSAGPGGVATAADRELGQVDLNSKDYPAPSASSMHYPVGVAVDGWDNVLVADQENIRVMRYDQPFALPTPVLTSAAPSAFYVRQEPLGGLSRLAIGTGFTRRSVFSGNGTFEYWGSRAYSHSNLAGLGAITNLGINVLSQFSGGVSSNIIFEPMVICRPGDAAVDGVLGQPSPTSNAPGAANIARMVMANGATHHAISAANMESPQAVAISPVDGRVFVADAANHRVLSWTSAASHEAGTEADLVFGQQDFYGHFANRGNTTPSSFTLSNPSGLTCSSDGRLYVADTGNHRVMEYRPPFSNGVDGDVYWGQTAPNQGSPNRGGAIQDRGLSSPTALSMDTRNYLAIADTGNNRVLVIKPPREVSVQPPISPLPAAAVEVYGQPSYTQGTANNGGISAQTLASPQGAAFRDDNSLWISDTNNHRALHISIATRNSFGQAPDLILGQSTATAGSPNAGGSASATTLSGPTGIAAKHGVLAIADRGNQRVQLYQDPADGNDSSADLTLQPNTISDAVAIGNDHALWVAQASSARVLTWLEPLATPFDTWNLNEFTAKQWADPTIGGPFADPDHDGQANLLEYALDTHALTPNGQAWPALQTPQDNILKFAYSPARSDIAVHIERSDSLVQWTPVFDSSVSLSNFTSTGGVGTWTDSTSPGGPKEFYRLNVTLRP